jgi:hypothetical protein
MTRNLGGQSRKTPKNQEIYWLADCMKREGNIKKISLFRQKTSYSYFHPISNIPHCHQTKDIPAQLLTTVYLKHYYARVIDINIQREADLTNIICSDR